MGNKGHDLLYEIEVSYQGNMYYPDRFFMTYHDLSKPKYLTCNFLHPFQYAIKLYTLAYKHMLSWLEIGFNDV